MATWDTTFETSPANGDNPSAGAGKIRELKVEVGDRGNREHTWAGTTAADGIHRAGSAKVYFTTATPTLQPDGTTTLTTTDKGRLYYKSSTGSVLLIHNGTGFVSTGVTLSTSQTIYGAKTFKSAAVFSGGVTIAGALTSRRIATTGNIQEYQVYSTLAPYVASNATMNARGYIIGASGTSGNSEFRVFSLRRSMSATSIGVIRLVGTLMSSGYHPTPTKSMGVQADDSTGGMLVDAAAAGVFIEW